MPNTYKDLNNENRNIHQFILRNFQEMSDPGDPWMCRLSENDPEIVIDITAPTRETFSVYCYRSRDQWTSISPTRVAGMLQSKYSEVYHNEIERPLKSNSIETICLNGTKFWVPESLNSKMIDLISLVVEYNHRSQN